MALTQIYKAKSVDRACLLNSVAFCSQGIFVPVSRALHVQAPRNSGFLARVRPRGLARDPKGDG